ncbi:DUF2157 domain-containing protein [Cylindrospermum sp. FACHB-282]|uniref:DUF2157 domain-containing protein n=1 Tax=Cylindrospermum sp. FACHB-282 TaxID=2692794 RepID=UPI001687D316|nr:DUF2157 domain-containing protein [Cylindrospermum sp. FACHB-282]MBD2388042.1 DUF2157 domain-containing protein [Cylindrospermum sp. FACHB-282]
MSSPLDRPLTLQIKLPSSHPQLLEGLDRLLRLGLISDAQVRKICREHLTCHVAFKSLAAPKPQAMVATSDPVEALPVAAVAPAKRPSETPVKPGSPSFVSSMLQSLVAELSVRWLLFLGLFLVVLSSGVLAASQWERFPPAGQYGVLLAYSLSFWGFSFWADRQNNLRLTAQTLLIVALLLVPINFWAMDSFRLWQNPVNWIVMAIATLILSWMTISLCNNRTVRTNSPVGKLPLVNILGLSYLQWGWNLSGFPLIAVYLAMIGTTIITVYQNQNLPNSQENQGTQRNRLNISLSATVIIYALLVLLVRAIFVAGVDVTQLGLAVGICGWLVTWLAQKNLTSSASTQAGSGVENGISSNSSPTPDLIGERLGGILLFLGWVVSVITQPLQAIVVSGLGLWVCSRRLQRDSLQNDLAAIFFIGLQTIWLGWRLVPAELQQAGIAIGTNLTNSQNAPWALLGIALFPYIILMVALTDRLHRTQKRELAIFGEQLTLLLGVCLTSIALINPTLRSLNLLFSTITLAIVTQRRPASPPPLVYLTHITGVLTLGAMINWLLPTLSREIWASILLVVMLAEWGFSLGEGLWRRSAWYIGLALATVNFALLLGNTEITWNRVIYIQNYWAIIWLITPLALTGLASRTTFQRTTNSYLSLLAVGVAQLLTLFSPGTRLIGLGVAVVVMFLNTRYLRNQTSAVITIGYSLSFIGALLWMLVPQLGLAGWFVVLALAILSLWLGATALIRQGSELAVIYAAASDKWAIALCSLELLTLTLHSVLLYQGFATTGIVYLIATAITLGAIIYRSWRKSTNRAFYSIGWCLELLVAQGLGFGEYSIIRIAIANIALGLTTQFFGEWWRRRYQLESLPNSFHILPLIYGAFSVLLRFTTFTDWTGFCTLGVALIIIGVGRRRESFKPLLYLGMIGVSISAYELLFYQMSQATGGAIGDGLIAMSALGTSIMYAYRILSPWLISYFRLTPQELKSIAHLHWAWSSSLFIAAITVNIQSSHYVGLTTGVFLIRYALWQGRQNTTNAPEERVWELTIDEIWVYLGLIEAGVLGIYLQGLPIGRVFAQQLLPWNAAIACLVAYFLYILPWQRLGWSKTPWQRAAYILPLIILWQTALQINPIALIITAVYYIFLAKGAAQFRFTYLSVALINWALFSWFYNFLRLTDPLWYITPIGLSLLYIAQVDPQLTPRESKDSRHSLRMFSSGLICAWAILFHQNAAWIPGIFSLIAIFAGLALRVRAFLYVGTATFFITSIYQMVLFSFQYSFLKWIVGLLVGILLIYIAANFETRRAQISILLRNASEEFQQWQ